MPDIEDYISTSNNIPASFLRDVKIEGSGRIDDDTYIVVDYTTSWGFSYKDEIAGKYGPVIPYFTIAANPNFLPPGTIVYVDALRKYVVVTDSGGGLEYGMIDVFVGFGKDSYESWLSKKVSVSSIRICRKD